MLRAENSSSARSGFNYGEQPFLPLLLFPAWKKARAGSSPGESSIAAAGRGADNGGVIHYKGTRPRAQRCHMGCGTPDRGRAPLPLPEMLDTFPLSQP